MGTNYKKIDNFERVNAGSVDELRGEIYSELDHWRLPTWISRL